MQVTIEDQKVLQNKLKRIQTEEERLRAQRDQKEKEALAIATEEQKASMEWTGEQAASVNGQSVTILEKGRELKQKMAER